MKKKQKIKKSGERTNLFVYGTLKMGFPLNGWLEDSKYLGPDTIKGASLISLGAYPALVIMADESGNLDQNYAVHGELWSVPVEDFQAIRRMEERVGYSTVACMTESKANANTFVFAILRQGTSEWVAVNATAKKVIYDVRPIDDLPF